MGTVVLTETVPVVSTEPPGFRYRDGVLHADGVSLEAIASAVGTPAYVYSAGTIRSRYRELTAALAGVPHRLHYAVKACSNVAILALLRELGSGVDIVSGGELHRVRTAGFVGRDVVYSGVGKTEQELADAIAAGVLLINVESEAELHVIDAVAERLGTIASVALRINPEVTVETPHAYIKTGEKGNKFGIPRDDVARLAQVLTTLPHVALRGMGMHLGSQIVNAQPLREALPHLLAAIEAVRGAGHQLTHVDLGGGLMVPYAADEPRADLADYAAIVRSVAQETGLEVVLEPGRFLVGEAGVLLSRVAYRKHTGGKELIITDAGMNDLIRPALYQAHHTISPVVLRDGEVIVADVVGPVCESGDFFAKGRTVSDMQRGDLVVLETAGAYGFSMASTYNTRARPAEVLADGGRFAVIGARETYDDLLRLERIHPDWREA